MELLRKLNHKGNGAVYVMDSPGEFYDSIEKMKEETEVVTSFTTKSHVPLLLVFIRDKADLLAKMDEVKRMIDSNTILWFAYPKKSSKRYKSDITRDAGWDPLGAMGYEPVRQIPLDEDWSALRFKAVATIKKLTRNSSMTLSTEAKRRLEN
jgi:hypothetical protein